MDVINILKQVDVGREISCFIVLRIEGLIIYLNNPSQSFLSEEVIIFYTNIDKEA